MKFNELFTAARKQANMSQTEVATAAGMKRSAIALIESGRPLTNRDWEKAIAVVGLTREEFLSTMSPDERKAATESIGRKRLPSIKMKGLDAHIYEATATSAGRLLPVMGQPSAGAVGRLAMGEPSEYDVCPPWLERVPSAYYLDVPSTSMVPRFLPGERIAVHPGKPYNAGDYVVVQYDDNGDIVGIIKKFVAWDAKTGDLILEQYNPPEEIRVPEEAVREVHKVFIHGLG